MFKTITNKDDYIKKCDVECLPISYDDKMEVNLFGKSIFLERNPWLWHLHLKVTDICNAHCSFCVEQNSECKNHECGVEKYLSQVEKMLNEMERNNILFSVSVTGGEPLLFRGFDELCGILSQHEIQFLTINTNASFIEKKIKIIDGLFDFVDISRHAINDDDNNKIFGANMITLDDLKRIKSKMHNTKMRIQCVMSEVNSIEAMNNFIDAFSFADDISFRKLMKLGDEYGVAYEDYDDSYTQVLEYAYNNWTLKEQTIQDYYVYEIWNCNGIDITFSYSNMKMLRQVEKKEPKSVCREFIIHPNGVIAGSWNPNEKIILQC